MEDSLIVIFSMILAVILMFVFPIMDTWERQDDISYMMVYAATVEFVDSARNLGYITTNMYDEFLTNISATGNKYDVTLEHRERIYSINGYKNIYTTQIEEVLYGNGALNNSAINNTYSMKAGDYLYVSVKNTNKTQSTLLKDVLYASSQETFKIGVPYGGMVRNTSVPPEEPTEP